MAQQFRIVCGSEAIGSSALEMCDPYQGIRAGRFTPTPQYDALEPLFQELSMVTYEARTDSGESLRTRRELLEQQVAALGLSVTTSTGERVPTAWVWIEDYAAELDDAGAREVTICLTDAETYDRFVG